MTNNLGREINQYTASQLEQFVVQIETLDAELKIINAYKSNVYKSARNFGFDIKILKRLVNERRMHEYERIEQEALLEMYRIAVNKAELKRKENQTDGK